jgi:hypothetical protein
MTVLTVRCNKSPEECKDIACRIADSILSYKKYSEDIMQAKYVNERISILENYVLCCLDNSDNPGFTIEDYENPYIVRGLFEEIQKRTQKRLF